MKRALLLGLLLVAANVLGGCPIYPTEDYACASQSDCPAGWACDYATGYCYEAASPTPNGKSCTKPSDCGANETCGKTGRCGIGSCTFHGCVTGYTCEVASGVWACVESSDSGGAAGAAGAPGGGGVAGAAGASGSAGGGAGGSAGSSSGGSAGSSSGGTAGSPADASAD